MNPLEFGSATATTPAGPPSVPSGPTPRGEGGFGLVEALVAAVVLAVGLLAVGGIALSVAAQTRRAAIRTDQTLAGQQILEATVNQSFDQIGSGSQDTTLTVGGRDYTVSRYVTAAGFRTKQVEIVVSGAGDVGEDTLRTTVRRPRSL